MAATFACLVAGFFVWLFLRVRLSAKTGPKAILVFVLCIIFALLLGVYIDYENLRGAKAFSYGPIFSSRGWGRLL